MENIEEKEIVTEEEPETPTEEPEIPEIEEPSKDITIGKIKITLVNELIQMINNELNIHFITSAGFDEIMDAFCNNTGIQYGDDIYEGFTEVTTFKYSVDNTNKKIFGVSLKEPSLDIVSPKQTKIALNYAIANMPDEIALTCVSVFESFEEQKVGFEFVKDKRYTYNEKELWRVKKTHKKQLDWYPGADPTLWEQVDSENHKGTIDDPIPVPDSVTTSGFTYIKGKYYLENESIYLMSRDGMKDGDEVILTFKPSQLTPHYFTLVEKEKVYGK